jgi:hypothetical protein
VGNHEPRHRCVLVQSPRGAPPTQPRPTARQQLSFRVLPSGSTHRRYRRDRSRLRMSGARPRDRPRRQRHDSRVSGRKSICVQRSRLVPTVLDNRLSNAPNCRSVDGARNGADRTPSQRVQTLSVASPLLHVFGTTSCVTSPACNAWMPSPKAASALAQTTRPRDRSRLKR